VLLLRKAPKYAATIHRRDRAFNQAKDPDSHTLAHIYTAHVYIFLHTYALLGDRDNIITCVAAISVAYLQAPSPWTAPMIYNCDSQAVNFDSQCELGI